MKMRKTKEDMRCSEIARFDAIRKEKDEIRKRLGKSIMVHRRKHIIVPVDRRNVGGIDQIPSYLGHFGWALSKIEKEHAKN